MSKTTTVSYTKAPTKIIKCSCQHATQDGMFGKGQRLHNPCKSASGTAYRCSVCHSIKH